MKKPVRDIEAAVIRFVGDSGDGIQLFGSRFTDTSALAGNDISTFPDFPAEIRAPAGTLAGVSGFQLHFASRDILTSGDRPDVLVTMNPAGLKVHLPELVREGTIIANSDAFTEPNLQKAGYAANPLDDGSLSGHRVISVPVTRLNREAVGKIGGLKPADMDRCRNFFALGVVYWLYDRPLDHTVKWIRDRFKRVPAMAEANEAALRAGHVFAEATELLPVRFHVGPASLAPGQYREITGNDAMVLGLVAASVLSGHDIFLGSYPITPASGILEGLARFKRFRVKTFQAEDEIAAVTAAIGASFAGAIGVTATSGPGLALKAEAINLAVMTELPLVVINVQRAGPSTGMPTKTEQADLLQALAGRPSESPVAVLAPATPSDCFDTVIEAVRIAVAHMTPVIVLSDLYLAFSSEPWRLPQLRDLPKISIRHPGPADGFAPYARDRVTLARPWAIPGTAGLEHRVGGLEKSNLTGGVNYDALNHQKMTELRAEKIARIADSIPDIAVRGAAKGDLLVVGWGSTFGAIATAVDMARKENLAVSAVHLRHLNPFPKNLGALLAGFPRVLVPENNLGQLLSLLRAKYLVDAEGFFKVQGRPFSVGEILEKIKETLAHEPRTRTRAV